MITGVVLCPRPPADVSPRQVVNDALRASPSKTSIQIRQRLHEGCTPILEGSDTLFGREVWAIRLKIPPPARYPWLEVWIDKKNSQILASKEWGVRDGRVVVLGQVPEGKRLIAKSRKLGK